MQTEPELNSEVLKITMMIQEKYPELSKYIAEMPITIPDVTTPEITVKILQEYLESLNALLKKYAPNHESETK